MAKIEYKLKGGLPASGPKGRIPYIKFENGEKLGDTNAIIAELKKRNGDVLNASLTQEQKAVHLAFRSLLEDRLYYMMGYLRWKEEESWKHVKKIFQPFMPPVVGGIILSRIRKTFLEDFSIPLVTENSKEDIYELSKEAIAAISKYLGEKPYFFGNEPTETDALLYGFLIQLIWVPWDSPMKQQAIEMKNLVPYCQRMQERYWADLKPEYLF